MRRSTGAILRDRRPATIMRSDWRGDPRNTSAPKRAMSYRPQLIAIISIAQHARPNVTGQMADRRSHCTIFSTVVVRIGISISAIRNLVHAGPEGPAYVPSGLRTPEPLPLAAPVEGALPPDVDVARQQQPDERQQLPEPGHAELLECHRPGIQEGDLDVEEQEDHRDEVELDRLSFASVADGGHAA